MQVSYISASCVVSEYFGILTYFIYSFSISCIFFMLSRDGASKCLNVNVFIYYLLNGYIFLFVSSCHSAIIYCESNVDL